MCDMEAGVPLEIAAPAEPDAVSVGMWEIDSSGGRVPREPTIN